MVESDAMKRRPRLDPDHASRRAGVVASRLSLHVTIVLNGGVDKLAKACSLCSTIKKHTKFISQLVQIESVKIDRSIPTIGKDEIERHDARGVCCLIDDLINIHF